jgi:cytochrome c-type biogenesis protein CcmH/NrfF
MGKELLLQQQQQDNPLLYEEEEQHKMFKDVEQEIECPRCSDMMALSSDFDRICYFCQECNLSLLVN